MTPVSIPIVKMDSNEYEIIAISECSPNMQLREVAILFGIHPLDSEWRLETNDGKPIDGITVEEYAAGVPMVVYVKKVKNN